MGKRRKTTKPNIIVKYCVVCGAKIYVNRSTAKYCSDACRMQAYLESKKLQKAEEDMLEEDRSVLVSKKPGSELSEQKNLYQEEPSIKSVRIVPTDTEENFRKLSRELEKIVLQSDQNSLGDYLKFSPYVDRKMAEYEKRYNTTIKSSKERFPNVNFKFSDPG